MLVGGQGPRLLELYFCSTKLHSCSTSSLLCGAHWVLKSCLRKLKLGLSDLCEPGQASGIIQKKKVFLGLVVSLEKPFWAASCESPGPQSMSVFSLLNLGKQIEAWGSWACYLLISSTCSHGRLSSGESS